MCAVGKNVISTVFLISVLFTVHSCKKPKYISAYEPKDFYGEWKLECKFWDTDSNGLDSGDVKYLANPKDSFTWYFKIKDTVCYFSGKVKMSTSKWFLLEPNKNNNSEVLLYPDFENRKWIYRIQKLNTQEMIIYCRQTIYDMGLPRVYWYGWKLLKV